ncbi:helicase associated domain-containing protein, partial [Amycolatopsis sp. NPDC000746]
WWNVMLPAVDAYRATVGDGPIPSLYRTPPPDDLPLGDWVHKQYQAAKKRETEPRAPPSPRATRTARTPDSRTACSQIPP